MTIIDKCLSGIAAAATVASVVCYFLLTNDAGDNRTYRQHIEDVCNQKQYASYFISAITLFFALSIRANFSLKQTAVVMLLSAFLLAGFTISFIHVKVDGTDEPTNKRPTRKLWASKLVSLNLCIALTLLALIDALQNTIFQGAPTG